jgi:hypothetical protein
MSCIRRQNKDPLLCIVQLFASITRTRYVPGSLATGRILVRYTGFDFEFWSSESNKFGPDRFLASRRISHVVRAVPVTKGRISGAPAVEQVWSRRFSSCHRRRLRRRISHVVHVRVVVPEMRQKDF